MCLPVRDHHDCQHDKQRGNEDVNVSWLGPCSPAGLVAGRHFGVGGPVADGAPASAEDDRVGLARLHVVGGRWTKLGSTRQVDFHSYCTDSQIRSVGQGSDELVRIHVVVELQAHAAPLGIPVLGAVDVRATLFPFRMAVTAFAGMFALLLDGGLPRGVVSGAARHDGEG